VNLTLNEKVLEESLNFDLASKDEDETDEESNFSCLNHKYAAEHQQPPSSFSDLSVFSFPQPPSCINYSSSATTLGPPDSSSGRLDTYVQ
jgi:hypothetical protein